ncbi:MAG TPA: CDP-6-deoxy-delta-3,4-glucoseen reductase [Thiomonas arsenitoxydans]|jgi:CDP-4-dehydro-6-deoxyglucose reductase|uniref:Oxidoreductase FAD/NAD(P)-binding domain protein n=1 Tax=Thiomonas intermedia (strain K12) TaxID=75379 RepID=D5X4U3_THIK1|nr:CDP-6-deoxy-delta-3,4-glucoseen reductase [Thiomonas sp.]OZB73073.1 MAG: CDP-6-deoxy-delta-3,4-glucoseen reductase [Thiomonas sp. 14-64-326]HOI66917.1 CDP-6-deoxy-delta-3,4-glucoseen reductase [Thiomonas arsenitoxydans]
MSHQVTVQPSGHQYAAEADETLLAAAIRQSVGLPYGCQDGACGSCKCKLLQGEIELGVHQLKALSEAERAQGFILACRAKALTDVVIQSHEVVGAGEFAVKKMPARVSSIEHLAPDVVRVMLQLPAADPLRYRAGQYIQFLLRDGARRSYSMASAPSESPQVELHLRHMPGGKFTDHVFTAMKEKEIQRIEGPFGSFFLRDDPENKPLIFLASGTGFAPIKAILEQMRANADPREVTLYWGGRKQQDLYLHDWAVQQCAAMPHLRFIPVLSDADADWSGRTGFVHRAVMDDVPDLSGYAVYACGAPVMVEAAQRDFTQLCQLPEDAFFADAFTTEADKAGAKA